MTSMIAIATILSLACVTASASDGRIAFTGRIVQPTVTLDASRLTADRSPFIASVRVESLTAKHGLANPLLDYFVGYLAAAPLSRASASLVDVTYN